MPKTTIRQRAVAIIADAAQYDDDTRRAIQLSLERDSPKMLAELVKRAEAGETVWYIADDDPAIKTPHQSIASSASTG
jgi:hypothetical protein